MIAWARLAASTGVGVFAVLWLGHKLERGVWIYVNERSRAWSS